MVFFEYQRSVEEPLVYFTNIWWAAFVLVDFWLSGVYGANVDHNFYLCALLELGVILLVKPYDIYHPKHFVRDHSHILHKVW